MFKSPPPNIKYFGFGMIITTNQLDSFPTLNLVLVTLKPLNFSVLLLAKFKSKGQQPADMVNLHLILLIVATLLEITQQQKFQPRASKETLSKLDGEFRSMLKAKPAFIGGFVRLAFHDCIGKGRCDGCINLQNIKNKGLEAYTPALENLYQRYKRKITRADLYAFAGVVTANYASSNTSDVFDHRKFRVGRRDCSRNGIETDLKESFPDPNMQNVNEVWAFFKQAFDLSLKETVALMGAHTLGKMRTKNSGFEGPWIADVVQEGGANILDSNYYLEIVAVPWFMKKMKQCPRKHQWQRNGPSMGFGNSERGINPQPDNVLINSDAALAVNLHLDVNGAFKPGTECVMCSIQDNGSPPGETLPCCDEASAGRQICIDYARNNTLWMEDFEKVFYKMIDNPDDSLSIPSKEGRWSS